MSLTDSMLLCLALICAGVVGGVLALSIVIAY